jgi:general stress protein 26
MTPERQRVRELIRRAGVAMFMNVDEQGTPLGRPMLPLFLDDDPRIYFLTHRGSRKVTQLEARPRVALTFDVAGAYVVVVGSAMACRDPELLRRLWSPTYRAWFPDGPDGQDAIALRIIVDRVDYWEPPRSRLLRLAHAVTALVTGRASDTPMKTLHGA